MISVYDQILYESDKENVDIRPKDLLPCNYFPVQPGLEAWHTVFYVTSGLLFFEFILFTIFGSSVEQSWNTPKDGGDYEMPAAVYH